MKTNLMLAILMTGCGGYEVSSDETKESELSIGGEPMEIWTRAFSCEKWSNNHLDFITPTVQLSSSYRDGELSATISHIDDKGKLCRKKIPVEIAGQLLELW